MKPITVKVNPEQRHHDIADPDEGTKGGGDTQDEADNACRLGAGENIYPTDPAVSSLVVLTKPRPNLKHGRH